MRTIITRVLLCWALALSCMTTQVSAQENTSDLKLDLIGVEERLPNKNYLINIGYALKFDIPLPRSFSVRVPDIDGIENYLETADDPNIPLFRVTYVGQETETPNNEFLVENISFFNLTIATGPREERITRLGQFLAQKVFPVVTEQLEQPNYLGGGAFKIGELDAVEIIGSYQDAQNGEMGLRIVGVLHPQSEDGIFSIANIATRFYSLTGPNDLARTATGTIMREFSFIEY